MKMPQHGFRICPNSIFNILHMLNKILLEYEPCSQLLKCLPPRKWEDSAELYALSPHGLLLTPSQRECREDPTPGATKLQTYKGSDSPYSRTTLCRRQTLHRPTKLFSHSPNNMVGLWNVCRRDNVVRLYGLPIKPFVLLDCSSLLACDPLGILFGVKRSPWGDSA